MKKETCQSCQHSRIEYIKPVEENEPLIMGIDYQYRCKLSHDVVEYDYYCEDFELPF